MSIQDWSEWGYERPRVSSLAIQEHDHFQNILRDEGVDVHLFIPPPTAAVDACYLCDPVLMLPDGAVINRMGKERRRSESAPVHRHLMALGVPIVGQLAAPEALEGGDCVWLDEKTLAVGIGLRSNQAAVDRVRGWCPDVEVMPILLPQTGGPEACFHLGSILSMLDRHLALVYAPLVPDSLSAALEARGVQVLECSAQEFPTQGCNILCTGPSRVVMADGNPQTRRLLESHGVVVMAIPAQELMVLGTGGPTCLVLALNRGARP